MMHAVHLFGAPLPVLTEYDRALATRILWWKQVLSYGLLTLLLGHATMAVGYHHILRRDRVLQSMLPAESEWATKAVARTRPRNDALRANR
jgi:cytochrome b561